jgi:hypothetical protein
VFPDNPGICLCQDEAVFIFPRDVSYYRLSSSFDTWMSWKQQFIQVRSIVKKMEPELQHSEYIKGGFYLNFCHPTDSSTCKFQSKMTACGQSTEGRACQVTEHSCQVHCQTENKCRGRAGAGWGGGIIENWAALHTQRSLNSLPRGPNLRLANQIRTTEVLSRIAKDLINSLM